MDQPGTTCQNSFTWSWREADTTVNAKLLWLALSPDGTYVLAAGTKQSTGDNHHRYIVKLNALTGAVIWSTLLPTDATFGVRSGYETIAFTQDGGFIVGGYSNHPWTEFPSFKSGGQLDNGTPILQKFSAATASAASMGTTPTPEWTYSCSGGNSCDTLGSSKAVRVYLDQGVEKVVTVPGVRAAVVVVDASTGAEVRFISIVTI